MQYGSTRLYAFDQGGSAFHDLGLMPGVARIRTVSEDELWRSSEALLEDLGLLDDDTLTLSPARIGGCTSERYGDDGAVVARWSCGQAASWDIAIDGWPSFGPGSDVTVRYGDQGVIFAFEETVRALSVAAEFPVISAIAHLGLNEPDANVLWYQPAVRGVEIPALPLPAVD